MQRRKFLAAAATAAIPFAAASANSFRARVPAAQRQLIELRTYEIQFGGSGQNILRQFLADALSPTLVRLGCQPLRMMTQLGGEDPAKLWVLIAYPDAATYAAAQDLSGDAGYQAAAAAYRAVPTEKPIFSRYTSWLLLAFTGMPAVIEDWPLDAGLFELRTYEGYSEDAVSRKVRMFNEEEMPVFDKTGLHPVFFGEMIAGPYRPSLVYMLHFKDMEERDTNWSAFSADPDWKTMRVKEEYANSVSNIRRVFLEPVK